jgi:hypothetical protein
MDMQPIVDTATAYTSLALCAVRDAAVWGGRKIQSGYVNYLVPAVKYLWSNALSLIKTMVQSIKQGHGLAFAIAGSFFVFGIAAFKIADRHAYEQDLVSKAAWKTLGITSFVLATVVTSTAIASIVVG